MNKNGLILAKTNDFCNSGNPKLTVVLIHGIASDSSTFDGLLGYLKQSKKLDDVRFVTFDLLSSGKSMKSDDLNYDYTEQLTALRNAIKKLDIKTPLVLVGHSLGTFIVTRYADKYKDEVKSLILISAPVYTKKDFDNPAFITGIKLFKDAVSVKDPALTKEKSFNNLMDNIVLDKNNYDALANIKTPTNIIYGELDQFIASFNYPKLLKDNPKYIIINKTPGRHGVSHDKYDKVCEILEKELDETIQH